MSQYKLIAFDMDGTLLDSRKELLPETITAVKEACARGKHVALCTGRCISELSVVTETLDCVRYAVCMNGTMVYDFHDRKIVFAREIEPEVVRKLVGITSKYDLMLQVMSMTSIIEHDKQEHIREYHAEPYEKLFLETADFVDDFAEFYAQNCVSVYKFNIYCRDTSDREKLAAELSKLDIVYSYCETTGIECSVSGVAKGTGLTALCEHLNLSKDEVIAVGDADNDLTMLKAAGLAIAMGNANQNVIAISDVIVRDNDHGGPVDAVYKYLLANE